MSDEALRIELTAKLAELEKRLASIKRDVTQEHSSDSAEQAQERENDEVIDAIGDETRAAIAATRAALARIEAGTYGICDSCGAEISPGRLAVLPEATRCINCAA
ncbi:MAG: TraR/DksA C4-type zinc finger protein [Halieaceae bacterium]|jgi:RNA polymerase-binding transcription factor DksA|nr:TraR/DksA C4-type zinc finger protein [Halieaceae bacterium]